jgi:putative ABC transport system ATP-binding protein
MPTESTVCGPLDSLRSPNAAESYKGRPLDRLWALLRDESTDLWAVFFYSAGIGLLTLVIPVAVQALVNTVAFGALLQPVVVLTILAFAFLVLQALINAYRVYAIEILQRRIFVRVAEDFSRRLLRARVAAFDGVHGPELVNRFFDVVTVQKSAALLLLDGLSLVMQTAVGMVLLAVYHPLLLAFDALMLTVIAVIIFGLGRGAVATSIAESKTKYAIAAWLEELASHRTAFKSDAAARFALSRADELANQYLDRRESHFRIILRQVGGALALQALASALLLGIGGFLVIERQLTLGQLVAAELIVTSALTGFSKFGQKFETFYDLLAALDKLGEVIDLPLERTEGERTSSTGPAQLTLHRISAVTSVHGEAFRSAELTIAAGERVVVSGAHPSVRAALIDLVLGLRDPQGGALLLDGTDYREIAVGALRDSVVAIRGDEVFSGTILENVIFGRTEGAPDDAREALRAVGLFDEFIDLPDGLQTRLQPGGLPLSPSQTVRLATARAISGRPRLIVVDDLSDRVEKRAVLDTLMARLSAPGVPWTLICFGDASGTQQYFDRELHWESGVLIQQKLPGGPR